MLQSMSDELEVAPSAFMQEFARRLRACMDASETLKTQNALANAVGLAQSSISKMLLGKSEPTVSNAAALAAAFGIPLEQLVPGGPAPNPISQVGSTAIPGVSLAIERRLSDLQRAMLGMAARLAAQRKLTDRECLVLMHQWMTLHEPAAENGTT
jgi:transcriptional regulator with XRE-family HTH domain